jgi:hypothetical protein
MPDAPIATTPARPSPVRHIATLQEGPLHAALKAWYAEPGDRCEVPVDGRQIDLVRGDLLVEIQTGSVSAIRRKLTALVAAHPVRLVYPVPAERWIVRVDRRARTLGRRRSPRRGRLAHAFRELVGVAPLLAHPAFSLEVVLTREEEVRRHALGQVWRRKGWEILERRLVDVVDRRVFTQPGDYAGLLPDGLPAPFTTADLARALEVDRDLAQKMAYCLRAAGAIDATGKVRRAVAYMRRESA